MNDRELILQIRTGDRNALSRIIDKYYKDIYWFCLYLTSDKEESYDITQEVFLRFIKYMSSYTHGNLKGYLLIIARNLCYDYLNKKAKRNYIQQTDQTLMYEENEKIKDTSGNLELEHAELRYLFHVILGQLPAEQREVIILRFGEELKFKEIAKVMGCSQSTVKSRYRLAIARLRKEMSEDED